MNPTQNTTTIKIDPFNSKTGAGTLSYYAGKYGTTVDALTKLNNIKDPNVIQSGGQLKVPTPLLQTTTGVNTQDKKNISDLGAIKDTLTNNQANQQNTQQNNGNPNTNPPEKSPTDNGMSKERQSIDDKYKSEIDMVNSNFDSMKLTSSATTQALIDSIKAKYASRITKMEDINKRSLAAKEKMGYRSGRARYASLIQEGILTGEELDGQQRISELHAEELSLIAQAEKAQGDLEMELLDKHMTKLSDIQDRKVAELQNLSRLTIDRERLALDKIKQERDISKQDEEMMYKKSQEVSGAMLDSFSSLKTDSEKSAFIEKMAKEHGVDPDVLLSDINDGLVKQGKDALDIAKIKADINQSNASADASRALAEQRRNGNEDFGGGDTANPQKESFYKIVDGLISSSYVDPDTGIPVIDKNTNLITAEAFKDILAQATKFGVSRDEVISKYKEHLYLKKYKFAKNYGLTEEEFNRYSKK